MRTVSLILFFIFINVLAVNAKTLAVGPDKEFTSIKTAIASSNPFDTIMVYQAHYPEHSLVIDKPLVLLGRDKPVIDAEGKQAEIFIVAADSVVIDGFVLKNTGVSFLSELSAIKVKGGKAGIIRNNEIRKCFFGIYLEYANHYVIENNRISGDSEDEASAGNAIHVWKAKNVEIAHNILTGHRDGIYFEFVDESYIHHNKSFGNLRYGLHFMFSNDDEYLANEFRENGAGVAVMFSRQITMTENLFSKNWGGASYGLLLKEISDGKIASNKFIRNTVGILAEGANRILIEQNQFRLNGTALDIKGNCLDNRIVRNDFVANTFEVVTNSRYNTNEYDGNYWSAYSGYDLNKDGVGDVSYRPVSLFARITNEIPSATLMTHSFFVNLLEFSERVFPALIPAELIDEHPKMKPYFL